MYKWINKVPKDMRLLVPSFDKNYTFKETLLKNNPPPPHKKCGKFLLFICSRTANWFTIWPPSSWSMFMQFVRTNNNVEGTHNNLKAVVGKLPTTERNSSWFKIILIVSRLRQWWRISKRIIILIYNFLLA